MNMNGILAIAAIVAAVAWGIALSHGLDGGGWVVLAGVIASGYHPAARAARFIAARLW